ncbi:MULTISPECIES: ammonium transporter [unclassified Erwinia]|uniref:ammonium transporter n=1 Tax=unclassified Erwinia TaxID=2622719 RepID=UPI0021105B7B|nr:MULTISPECIES: ammonium transporter [unclassified Erwinia]
MTHAGIPLLVHFVYQMMFAIITPALITGAFAHRVNFSAYMIFITLWTLLVYCPFVHMIWSSDGFFARWGVADFAGGIVVHATAGLAALASAIYVGKRMVNTQQDHNIPFVALGAGLLWFGWYGFNAGSEFQINTITVSAFVATDISAAFAAIVWLIIDRAHCGTVKLSSFLTGAVAGLATITPAAGYVSLESAAIIGVIGSIICYYSVLLVRRHIDDALDVFAVHGMGGITGSILVGVFASMVWSQSGSVKPVDSGTMQIIKQTCAVLVAALWSFVATLIILKLADTITPVKINKDIVGDNLDQKLLGETAYE